MNRKIIVTGSRGFIGRYLVRGLLDQGDEVYSVVRSRTSECAEPRAQKGHIIIESDLKDLTPEHFPGEKYDAFFHLGWHGVNREEIDDDKIHEESCENAKRCLRISHTLGCKAFLDVGSRAEYGVTKNIYTETGDCSPVTAYAREKLRFYQYAHEYTKGSGQDFLHFRIFSVIGVGDHPWSLISTACKCLKRGEHMYMGACDQLWNFMDVRDAVEAMVMAYDHIADVAAEDNRIINIAGHDTRILRSFIEEIRIMTKSTSELVFDRNRKSENVIPDISKLMALTGWRAKYTFADTVRDILEADE